MLFREQFKLFYGFNSHMRGSSHAFDDLLGGVGDVSIPICAGVLTAQYAKGRCLYEFQFPYAREFSRESLLAALGEKGFNSHMRGSSH